MTTQQEARLQKRILRLLVTEHCCPPGGTSMSHYPYTVTCVCGPHLPMENHGFSGTSDKGKWCFTSP
jgi:hypothetical protein